MKLTTLIVDDEIEAQNRLLLHLKKFDALELLSPASDGEEALKSIEDHSPNLVFLDIEMPEMNGFEMLAAFSEPYPYIIFVTAYDQYAVNAFEQNAIDYILKPYSFERIEAAVKKAIHTFKRDQLLELNEHMKDFLFEWSKGLETKNHEYITRIAVKTIGQTDFINVDDIIYIEAADQYVDIHTPQKKYLVRESMEKLNRQLDPDRFFRTHRSYIVNLECVERLEQLDKHNSILKLTNQSEIKLSRSKKQLFKSKMNY